MQCKQITTNVSYPKRQCSASPAGVAHAARKHKHLRLHCANVPAQTGELSRTMGTRAALTVASVPGASGALNTQPLTAKLGLAAAVPPGSKRAGCRRSRRRGPRTSPHRTSERFVGGRAAQLTAPPPKPVVAPGQGAPRAAANQRSTRDARSGRAYRRQSCARARARPLRPLRRKRQDARPLCCDAAGAARLPGRGREPADDGAAGDEARPAWV
jgi:hypothetical protein